MVNKETEKAKNNHAAEKAKTGEKPGKESKTEKHSSRRKEEKPSPVEEPETKLANCEKKSNELQDKYLRLAAEFDNYRKRTLKEKIDLTKLAGEQILLNMLPVIDDFERGLKTIDEAKELGPVKDGIHLIYNKFREFLNQNGVKEIDAASSDFNIELHEAVSVIPAPADDMKGKVVDVLEKGYTLNDKVIRYSKVVIGE